MEENVRFNTMLCKGCLLCTTVCPTSIITQASEASKKGYYPACVEQQNQEKCKQCGLCTLICPDAAISVKKLEKKR